MKNNFPPKSAGRLMTGDVPIISPDDSIDFVEKHLLKNVKKMESISYLYVVGRNNALKGVISIKELFRQPQNKKVSSVMVKNPIKAYAHSSQERVAYLALKNSIKSVPIVDKKNKFLGVVLNDDILNVIYNELHEDISHFAGVENFSSHIDNISSMPLLSSLKHRLPWLIIGIFGGLLAAQVIGLFEHTLAENIILAAFIPLVVYIASAVGTQVGFFVVRDLAINKKISFGSYTLRQFKVILSMGAIISLLIFLISLIFYGRLPISLVLSLAVFLTVLSSIITGIFIPYAFSRMRFDPANASGPIATIVQDLLSVSIYLAVASLLL